MIMIETLMILGIILLDRLSKSWAMESLRTVDTIPLWPDVFHLSYRTNTGAAFSIFREHTEILAVLSFVLSAGLIWYLIRSRRQEPFNLSHVGLSFIIGGAIGNGIDRLVYRYVVDMFDFRLINFAVFNVADSFITVGVSLIIFDLLFLEKKRQKKQA
ncbi:MAG TPA: signal peptidase II [Tissierellia bacterium]|nr:signal peptidase II [Tissierellia bacterium]